MFIGPNGVGVADQVGVNPYGLAKNKNIVPI